MGKRLDGARRPVRRSRCEPELGARPARGRPPVVLHATGSSLPAGGGPAAPGRSEGGTSGGLDLRGAVVPLGSRTRTLAEKLERAAQQAGVAVLGTGVNPGFVLDRLVATLGAGAGAGAPRASPGGWWTRARRREALQRKVGAGLTEDEFDALAAEGAVGHVGLRRVVRRSARSGSGIDWTTTRRRWPRSSPTRTSPAAPSWCRGAGWRAFIQTVVGLEDGQERVRLELTLALGAEPPGISIEIESDTRLTFDIPGGIPGDAATAQLVVNAAPRVAAAESGLLTVLDLPAGR